MTLPRELGFDECVRLLQAGVVGRVALATPDGPHIAPVNYSMVDDAIIVATTPYSALGTYGTRNRLAFEVDHFDHDSHTGWSVVVHGHARVVSDPAELRRVKQVRTPRPWADGNRNLYLRIPCIELSGRCIGHRLATPARRVVAAS